MKDPKEWQESDLKKLADEKTHESTQLEFKSSAALAKNPEKVKNISKAVSAMANTEGGVIVYGIAQDSKHQATTLDDGVLIEAINEEWLENIIDTNIHRNIPGVHIHSVDLSGHADKRISLVVVVPESDFAPHQANDLRYYRRRNFKAEPMEDWEIREVANRQVHPTLEAEFVFTRSPGGPTAHYDLSLCICNIGKVIAKNFAVNFWLPEFPNRITKGFVSRERKEVGHHPYLLYQYRNTMPGGSNNQLTNAVLFPEDRLHITDGNNFYLKIPVDFSVYDLYIRGCTLDWEVFADSAPPRGGSLSLPELIKAII
ncbi:MAG: ATP-binding protein [Candidatus Paceibacterota bacterium]